MGLAAKKIKTPATSNIPTRRNFFGRDNKLPFINKGEAIQSKLTVGKPNDKFEQQADNVADHVVNQQVQSSSKFFNTGKGIQSSPFRSKPFFNSNPILQTKGLLTESEGEVQKSELVPNVNSVPSGFESKLQSSKGGGSNLSPNVQSKMESGIGADFSSVKVHTGPQASQMSASIGAKAFTHGNDIYFNENQYQPESREGEHLLAHELTHTVQQGAAIQKKSSNISQTKPKVQRGLLDSIGSFFSGIRNRVISFVQSIPGYFLFTVLLGRDPLTDVRVLRNGHNIIKGFLLLLPGGQAKYDKLVQDGAMERSATWIDQQIAEVNGIQQQVSEALERAKNSISASDVFDVSGALDRIRGYFNPVITRASNFASRVVTQVLQFLKDAVLNSLVNFIKERTRAYPLLRVLLGKDPITNEEVPRTMEVIVEAFLMLTESGEAMYNKMLETGALARATAWMREQIANLPTVEEVINAFTTAWESISFEDLFQPVAAFQRIYNILNDPIGRILSFVVNVAIQILIFIKDAMLGWLKSNADSIPGYHLLTVLIGKDVFTQEVVPRTFTNIVRGFMGLIPGGEQQFQQMQESGVIPRLQAKINSAIESLGISWAFIVNLFTSIWNSMTIIDLLVPLVAFGRIIARFREPIGRLFAFIRVVIIAIVEVMLRMMNFPIDLIGQIIANAMQAYEDIKRDPIGFLKNLMRAAKQGFQQFFNNFVQHLIGGVTGWLFSELAEAGIQPPTDITFRSILGMAMEVLGITVDNILERLGRRIGQERVARIRSVMDRLSGIWEFVRDVMDRGPVAIWERIQAQISNLWNIVVDGIRNWIVTRIITAVTTKLLSMLDPTGIMPVINGFIAFFRAVQSFIEKLTQILQVINQFVMGVGEIARGNIQQAADFLEGALSRAMPVAIAFLANQVGLGGLGRRIGEMIGRARQAINEGIDWLIDQAFRLGQALLNRLLGGGSEQQQQDEIPDGPASSLNSLNQTFNDRTTDEHTLTFRGTTTPEIIVRSEPKELGAFIREKQNSLGENDPQQTALTQALAKYNELTPFLTQIASQDPSTPEHGQTFATIQTKYNEIIALLPALEVDDVVYPQMQLPPFSAARGNSFEAQFITKDRVSGAPAHSNAGSNDGTLEGWEEVQLAGLTGSGENWVRMHLLTHRFMGSYLNSNLTPTRSALNNPTFLELEADADSFVQNNPTEAIWYQVNISYQSVSIPSAISGRSNSGRTSANYLSTLNASWGKYDPANLNKIRHPGASKDTLSVSGIRAPDLSGAPVITTILTGSQFGVYKTQSGHSTNVALGSALGVTESTIRTWLNQGVPNSRESLLRNHNPAAFTAAESSPP